MTALPLPSETALDTPVGPQSSFALPAWPTAPATTSAPPPASFAPAVAAPPSQSASNETKIITFQQAKKPGSFGVKK
jgi:hypothetical protein